MEKPNTPATTERRPWPMKWIVLAIVVYVVGYTFVNVAYRKPSGSAHEPFAEAQERKTRTVQATMHGWTRFAAGFAQAPTDTFPTRAEIAEKPLPQPLHLALPPELPPIVPGVPSLHPASIALTAPAAIAASDSLRLRLEFPTGPSVPAFGEILAYARDNQLYVFVQDDKHVAPDTTPVPAASPLDLVLPPAALTSGTWQASLFTANTAYTWTFVVE